MIILSPLLADKGNIAFEGANFYLDEEYDSITDPNEKRLFVLLSVPSNIIKLFKDDLFSTKMGPLLISRAQNETNSLLKHELMLMIIFERPKDWNKIIDEYIVSIGRNSFFLSQVLHILKFNLDYRATEVVDRRILEMLASKCKAKHIFKTDNPDIGLINRLRRMDEGSKH